MELPTDLLSYRTAIRVHGDDYGAIALFGIELCDGRKFEVWITTDKRFAAQGRTEVMQAACGFTNMIGSCGLLAWTGVDDVESVKRTYQSCDLHMVKVEALPNV